jgi:hypothetical protein
MKIDITSVLDVIMDALSEELDVDHASLMTPEMGAVVRDKGVDRALAAAALRRGLGQFNDLSRCAEFVRGKHRRRLR